MGSKSHRLSQQVAASRLMVHGGVGLWYTVESGEAEGPWDIR